MTTFTVEQELLDAFEARWQVLRPTWDPATQTSKPPAKFDEKPDLWIELMITNQGGRNTAVGILDRVTSLFTVDLYNRLRGTTTIRGKNPLADDAYNAFRTLTYPESVDPIDISPRDFPVTRAGFEHKRLSLTLEFDLPTGLS